MANGYCPNLMEHIKVLADINDPSVKITPMGFLAMLKKAQPEIQLTSPMGATRNLTLKYRKRSVAALTSTTDDCDLNLLPAYQEQTVETTLFRKLSFMVQDADIRRYCEDAQSSVAIGGLPTPFMQEHLMLIMSQINGLLQGVNQDLVTAQATTFGKNTVTGLSTSTSVNFNDDSTVNLVSEGFTKLLTDYQANEGMGTPQLVGSGIIHSMMLQKAATGMGISGINQAILASGMEFHYDPYTATGWGSNQFGVFTPGSCGLIEADKFVGGFAGRKGASEFGNILLPLAGNITDGMNVPAVSFDLQLRYIDCPTEESNVYGGSQTVNRGWQITLSKNYALWNQPTDAFYSGDRLTGNNGSLRYTATNS